MLKSPARDDDAHLPQLPAARARARARKKSLSAHKTQCAKKSARKRERDYGSLKARIFRSFLLLSSASERACSTCRSVFSSVLYYKARYGQASDARLLYDNDGFPVVATRMLCVCAHVSVCRFFLCVQFSRIECNGCRNFAAIDAFVRESYLRCKRIYCDVGHFFLQ